MTNNEQCVVSVSTPDLAVSCHESFVYKWTNIDSGRYYIGKHKGHDEDGYVSSGRALLSAYNNDPLAFQRTILHRGTDRECLRIEQDLISEAIRRDGYDKMYNLTSWRQLSQWKRRCLHCNSIVDPSNEEWTRTFTAMHFENCSKNPLNAPRVKPIKAPVDIRTPKSIPTEKPPTVKAVAKEIKELLKLNVGPDYPYSDVIRILRKLKAKLMA